MPQTGPTQGNPSLAATPPPGIDCRSPVRASGCRHLTECAGNRNTQCGLVRTKQARALAYLFFAAVFEGCWFYNGFTPVFALQRRGLMKATAQQFRYIMRDEVLHCGFGIRVIRQLLEEENLQLDPRAVQQI